MILGTGIDMVEIERVESSIAQFGDKFLQRVFLPGEIAYASSCKSSALHFAARFAAKEAVSKAFGTGIGEELGWHDMEVGRSSSGRPVLRLHGQGIRLAETRGVREVMISLTHTKTTAAAVAILVGA